MDISIWPAGFFHEIELTGSKIYDFGSKFLLSLDLTFIITYEIKSPNGKLKIPKASASKKNESHKKNRFYL